MKATGVVRKLDQLGRVVIPKELRRTLDINENDSLEIFVDNTNIVLRKYTPGCIFCGETAKTVEYKGNIICKNCLQELKDNF